MGAPSNGGEERRVFASPLVRRIARQEGVDISQLEGSGWKGRITKRDIDDHLTRGPAPAAAAPASAEALAGRPVPAPAAPVARAAAPASAPAAAVGSGERVRAKGPGIFTPAVRGGTYVSAGARLGTMSDYYGRRTADIVAPLSGLVTFIRGVPSTWKDATLANVSPVFAEPPKR